MKKLYLKNLLTVLAIVFTHLAWAQSTFTFTGDTQMYIVPANVSIIEIEASGAQGGEGNGGIGGLGATMKGAFNVTPNDTLLVIVGGEGIYTGNSGSGGAGTGVTLNGNPLIVAGGGGGASQTRKGNGGVITLNGNNSSGAGGINGMGGHKGYISGDCGWAGGGGGFLGDGYGGNTDWDGSDTGVLSVNGGGQAWVNGGAGATGGGCAFVTASGPWGFGGGGSGEYGGGGGGGYSGGGGGQYVAPDTLHQSGGGGGSYNLGTNQNNLAANHSGAGEVTITVICQNTFASQNINACDSFVSISGVVYNTAGTYTFEDTLMNSCGADSILSTTLTLTSVNINISDISGVLKASLGLDTYQWYNENGILNGETNNEFTPSVSGNYYCEGTKNSCNKNSNIIEYEILNTGIFENNLSELKVFPNPTAGVLNIDCSEKEVQFRLLNISGSIVKEIDSSEKQINISHLENGIYILEMIKYNEKSITKIIKR